MKTSLCLILIALLPLALAQYDNNYGGGDYQNPPPDYGSYGQPDYRSQIQPDYSNQNQGGSSNVMDGFTNGNQQAGMTSDGGMNIPTDGLSLLTGGKTGGTVNVGGDGSVGTSQGWGPLGQTNQNWVPGRRRRSQLWGRK